MSARKAATKKRAPVGRRKPAKKTRGAAGRSSKAKLKSAHKPSTRTGKSAKRTSTKKVSAKRAAPKVQPKPSGKKTIATAPSRLSSSSGIARYSTKALASRRTERPPSGCSATAGRFAAAARAASCVRASMLYPAAIPVRAATGASPSAMPRLACA